jgi:hypothetical protein
LLADQGSRAPLLTANEARAAAERFAEQPAAAVTGPIDFDQWVVHQAFDRRRPYFRVALADASGTELYVSQLTGEVVQRTTRTQRLWNYVGSVVHWIYPTVIRRHWALWDRLVWWLALAGSAGVVLGLVLGVVRLRDAWRRGRRGLASPFIGWLRWHHVVGLVAGAFVTTWIVSGWLSMDHGRLFSEPDPNAAEIDAFRGIGLRDAAARVPLAALGALDGAREIALSAVGGNPVAAASYEDGGRKLFALRGGRLVEHRLTVEEVEHAVALAWPGVGIGGTEDVDPADIYGRLREGNLPPQTLRTRLTDAAGTWVHVDRQTGAIVSVMDRGRRLYRWLFNGLHSLDLPGLVERRPWWDATMLGLLAVGFLFSVTGVVLGYRRLAASLRSGS